MGRGPGVSIAELPDGRWRIRWRESVTDASAVNKRVQRERVVRDQATAIVLQGKILRALETGEVYADDARSIPVVASLDQVFAGWLRGRAARGASGGTLRAYGQRTARVLADLRARHGIAEGVGVPASLLTRDEVAELTLRLRTGGLAESTLKSTIGTVLAAWAWGCDDAATYPGLLPAPRDPTSVTPRGAVYSPTEAPTMAEVDAVLRILARSYKARRVALAVATIARCTGLRVSQILALRVGDVFLSEPSMTITAGKSQREKADRRTVPIAPALVDFLTPLVAGRSPDELVIRRRAGTGEATRGGPTETLGEAWEAATVAGDVRRETWNPSNRVIARPDHAFRAAFQAHLVTAGIRDEVIDALVGHVGGLRERHYVGASSRLGAMRDAVALIPPIGWGEAEALPSNVHRLR